MSPSRYRVIEIKQAEVDALAKNCSPATVGDLMLTELNMDFESVKKALDKSTPEEDEEGKPLQQPLGINIPKFFHREITLTRKLVPVWVAKFGDFMRIKSSKLYNELEKKHALAAEAGASADVEMGGMDSSVPISKTVPDAVDTGLRQQNKPGMNKQRAGNSGKEKAPMNKKTALPNAPGSEPKQKKRKGIKASAGPGIAKRKRIASGQKSGPKPKKR
ncbi:hypothetical protein HOY80DRAFT_1044405 [Tuber brumale]|nr:hypothetical protein HOY80DRAFT_1044405 [Tuber brumale]